MFVVFIVFVMFVVFVMFGRFIEGDGCQTAHQQNTIVTKMRQRHHCIRRVFQSSG